MESYRLPRMISSDVPRLRVFVAVVGKFSGFAGGVGGEEEGKGKGKERDTPFLQLSVVRGLLR